MTLAALFLQRGRMIAASAFIAVAMIEPNVALPAAIGLFVAAKSARVPLLVAAVAGGTLSIIAGGLALNFEYALTVLPAHALSEVSRDNQYSLSTVVAALGVPDRASVLVGTLSYAIMLALGVIVGYRLSYRLNCPAFAIVMPASFALIGGSFVHTEAIAAAVPASMLLASRAPTARNWAVGAALLLSVPWMLATSASLFLAPLYPIAFIARTFWKSTRTLWLLSAVAAFAIIATLFILAEPSNAHVTIAEHIRPTIDPALAESAWRDFVLNDSTNRLATWLLRLPTWIGLVVMAIVAASASRRATTLRRGHAELQA
jgi:hypothetical protein